MYKFFKDVPTVIFLAYWHLLDLPTLIFVMYTYLPDIVILVLGMYWYLMDIAKIIFGKYKIIYSNTSNQIILTIDDAPHSAKSLESILDMLQKYNQKATFFVISGQVNLNNRNLLIRAIIDGHHLANHGHRDKMHALFDYETLASEIDRCQQLLEELYAEAGVEFPNKKYYRPGCGVVTSTIRKYCDENNYTIVLGSNYCSDIKLPVWLNEFYIRSHLRQNDIIIIHDRPGTIKLLNRLFKKGITTVSLTSFVGL